MAWKSVSLNDIQIFTTPDSKVNGTNMGSPVFCRPQMAHMLALWTLLSGNYCSYKNKVLHTMVTTGEKEIRFIFFQIPRVCYDKNVNEF